MPQILMEQIRTYNDLYRAGTPKISDEHYDELLNKIKNHLTSDFYEVFRISLREPGGDIKLDYNIGSLKKCTYGTDEFSDFLKKVNPKSLFVSAKLDGMGYVAKYINGVLVSCSTTGDGITAEDITHTARYVLPNMLNVEGKLIVRGEFVMLKDKAEEYGYRNARNGVVGLMKKHEPDFEKLACVRCPAYEILNSNKSRVDQYYMLFKMGFETPSETVFDVTPETEENLRKMLINWKEESPYLIDGLVICDVNEKPENALLPERTVAFKVNLDVVKTKVIGMDIIPSKDGLMRGVAILKTVDLCGTDVSRATIYNYKNVKELGIGVGAEVIVTKAGDIIPKILEVTEPVDIQYDLYWKYCPECKSETQEIGVDMVCVNDFCSSKIYGSLESFIKKCGIKGASETSLRNWGISSMWDLLYFVPMGKNAVKFYDEFVKTVFVMPKEELIGKFNWTGAGEKTIKKYIDFMGFDKFIELAMDDCLVPIEHPEGCGELTWNKIVEKFDVNYRDFKLIIQDERYSPTVSQEKIIPVNSLNGKSFCCTGKVSRPRKEIEADIISAGGVIKSVSKNLDYLVAGEKAGSKLEKAQKLGVAIITETELQTMLEEI